MTAVHILLGTVAPALGSLVGICLFLSPVAAIQKIKKEKQLGEFNPIPFPVTCANCIAWVAYGYVTRNWWLFPPNVPGFLIATWMTFITYGYAPEKLRDTMLKIYIAAATFLVGMGIFTTEALDKPAAVKAWGYTSVVILLVFYSSPLSTLGKVIGQRDSSSLYFPTCFMALVNSTLWVSYGLVVGDYFIYGPNGAGAVLSLVQLALIFVFPAKGGDREFFARPTVELGDGEASALLLDSGSVAPPAHPDAYGSLASGGNATHTVLSLPMGIADARR